MNNNNIAAAGGGRYAEKIFLPNKSCDFAIKNCNPIVLSKTYSSHQRGIVQLPFSNIHLALVHKNLHQTQYNFFAQIKYKRNKNK